MVLDGLSVLGFRQMSRFAFRPKSSIFFSDHRIFCSCSQSLSGTFFTNIRCAVMCLILWSGFPSGHSPIKIRIFKVILHHWEMEPKTLSSMISQKVVDELWQNEVDELVKWQEQVNSILVKVRIQIRPISGIQNVNGSAWRRYALYQVPSCFTKCHSLSDFSFVCSFVCVFVFVSFFFATSRFVRELEHRTDEDVRENKITPVWGWRSSL